ncbi:MAG: hypothetical protein AAF570_01410 [Bacteroidota bacterium]
MTAGGTWNAGPTVPEISEFENKGLNQNTGIAGVFPFGCDNCTERAAPPVCDPPRHYDCDCSPNATCNVQRAQGTEGGTVEVTFKGWAK